jgi:hypothetical protein
MSFANPVSAAAIAAMPSALSSLVALLHGSNSSGPLHVVQQFAADALQKLACYPAIRPAAEALHFAVSSLVILLDSCSLLSSSCGVQQAAARALSYLAVAQTSGQP